MAIASCGVNDVTLWNGQTKAQRIAFDMFDDAYTTCMDKTMEEVDADFKSYAELPLNQGQIRLSPGVKNKIRAFIQWARDQVRLGLDPTTQPYPVAEAANLIRRYKTHLAFTKKSKTMAESAKPDKFTKDSKWSDWVVTLHNYLRCIPGRDGIPLNYVIRDNQDAIHGNHVDFLDDYVDAARLEGEAFTIDAADVHTIIANLISGNEDAETKIIAFSEENNGRKDYIALKEHYEGIGIHALDITKAERIIERDFYAGEKKPHMWWAEFEKRLTWAFNTVKKVEGRDVYSNEMKLRKLISKIKADFLATTKAAIEVRLAEIPMTMTYEIALSTFRNSVNQQYPPEIGSVPRVRRHVNEVNHNCQTRRYDSTRNTKNSRHQQRKRSDSKWITLVNGQRIEYHASFKFPSHIYSQMKQEDKDRLRKERAEYKNKQQSQRSIQQLQQQLNDVQSQLATTLPQQVPTSDNSTAINQMTTTSGTIMGGRNEQARKRQKTQSNVSVGALHTKRKIATVQPSLGEPIEGTTATNECDTNADTCCLGTNFIVLQYTNRTANVYTYDSSIAPREGVPIVRGATAYDHEDGNTYILVFNESLYYGSALDHSLINPNQVRHYGNQMWDNPFDQRHKLCIQVSNDVEIPMQCKGSKIQFTTRVPSRQELASCPHIVMTSPKEWEPSAVILGSVQAQAEQQITYEDEDQYILRNVDPSLVMTREAMIKEIQTKDYQSEYDPMTLDVKDKRTFISGNRHPNITPFALAERFGIGLRRARATMTATTQRGTRSAILPIARRYRADRMYQCRRLQGKFATDTLYSKCKSLRSNIAAQIYSHKCGFKAIYPFPKADGNHVGQSLKDFIYDYGAPEHLTFDGAMVQVGRQTPFVQTLRKHDIKHHVSSPRRPNENPAESAIRETKKRWYRIMNKHKVPERLWDYGIQWVVETANVTANCSRYADGRTPLEIITGITPDISEYLDFGFYDWVVFRSEAGLGPIELGRWLGVSHRIGQQMSYWILPRSGIPISVVTVQRLTNLEQTTDEWKKRMDEYETHVQPKLQAKSADVSIDQNEVRRESLLSLELEDDAFLQEYGRVINDPDVVEVDDEIAGDHFMNMEVGLPRGPDGTIIKAKVKKRTTDETGNTIGKYHANPLLDSRMYDVEFEDGGVEAITANIIAENILSQIDEEGHRQLMLDEIVDHRTTKDAIPKSEGTYETTYGVTRKKRTTRGWEICVRWKDGSHEWIALKDVKQSYPIELAEYAIMKGIQDEPAFAWWVTYTMKKRKAIIQKVRSKYWQKTHKYGIRIPKTVAEARSIDEENGDTLWMDAVRLEMKNARVAFKEYDDNPEQLIGFKQITAHLIFDVKLGENFRRKARLVADGHKMDTPASMTYSTVVSRDSVRILLTIAALNDLDVKGADIQNAFLTSPTKERVWMRAGPEFGNDEGKVYIVVRALYGMKSASASFRSFMAEKLDNIGFRTSIADPDVWIRPAVKSSGEEYYEYILMYVDDILVISVSAMEILQDMQSHIKFKNDKIETPDGYLGAKLEMKSLNGRDVWTITSVSYVKAAIANVERTVQGKRWKLPTRVQTPMVSSYLPELDETPELEKDDIQYYQELIGVLRWATELGRVDILLEVSLLSQYQAAPREGHLEQLLHIFAYLRKKPKATLYLDPSMPNLDYTIFRTKAEDFIEYYRDAKEQMPHQVPKPRGKPVTLTAYVDASHAANRKNRRSHSGFIVFMNRSPVMWYSKRQQTVETSSFSAEYIAMKVCVETIQQLRFKLRMFGIPMIDDEPSYVLCDNESVVNNSTKVESTLNKKHSSVAYHYVRWAVAARIISVAWIPTGENLADALTKRLSETSRDYLFGNWMY